MSNLTFTLNLEPTYDWFKFYETQDVLEENGITCESCTIVSVDGTDVASTYWWGDGIQCDRIGSFTVKYPTDDLLGQSVTHTFVIQYKETESSSISTVTLSLVINYPATVVERLTGVHFKVHNVTIDRSNPVSYQYQMYADAWHLLLNDLVEFEYSSGEDTYPRGNDFLQFSFQPVTRLHSWKDKGTLCNFNYYYGKIHDDDVRYDYSPYGSTFALEFKPDAKSGSDTLYLVYITPSGKKFTDSMTITMRTSNPNLIYARRIAPKKTIMDLTFTSTADNSKVYKLDEIANLYPDDATISTITQVRLPAPMPAMCVSRMKVTYNDEATTFGDFAQFTLPAWNINDLNGRTWLNKTWQHRLQFDGLAEDAHTDEKLTISIKCMRPENNDPNDIESINLNLYSSIITPGGGGWVYCKVKPDAYMPQKITWEILDWDGDPNHEGTPIPANGSSPLRFLKIWSDRCCVIADYPGYAKLKCMVDNSPNHTADVEFIINEGSNDETRSAVLTIQGEYSGAKNAVIPPGKTVNLMAINNTDKTAKEVDHWFSSDESIAIVDDNGNVTAVGPGTAKIYAILK